MVVHALNSSMGSVSPRPAWYTVDSVLVRKKITYDFWLNKKMYIWILLLSSKISESLLAYLQTGS